MNVFDGNLKSKINAVYVEQNRKTPLGVEPGARHNVTIMVDESYTNAWQSDMISQTSDVLVYAYPNSVLGRHSCVGGTLEVNGRVLRVETYAVAQNRLTGRVGHIELGCGEI